MNDFAVDFPSTSSARGPQQCFESLETEMLPCPAHVLTVGDYVHEPFPSLNGIQGFGRIKKSLHEDLGVEVGNALQLNAARNVLAGRNCFLIGSSHSKAGKSLAYMIPVIIRLLENVDGYAKLEGNGPLALIVCSTHASGLKLEESLMNLTQGSGLTYEFAQDQGCYDEDAEYDRRKKGFISSSNKSADILLCTAEVAAALVNDTRSPFSFDRLSFLVFDDAHVLLKFRHVEVKAILEGFKTFVGKLGTRKCVLQTIFCGSQWTPELEICFNNLVDIPVLIISSTIQAIRYCKFKINVLQTSEENRFNDFKELLSCHQNAKRIIVVMKDWERLKQLRTQCAAEKLDFHFLEGKGFVGTYMQTARRAWDCDLNQRVVICATDTNLRELQVSNADLLIHYDVPEDDLRTFAVRFTAIWSNVTNFDRKTDQSSQLPAAYVMLSTDLPEANVILWKLHTLGAEIPQGLLEAARKERLIRMKNEALCRGFICMGSCLFLDESECTHRHCFVDEDFRKETVLPKTGQVELFITETLAPNLYVAKVIRYCDRDPVTNQVINYEDYQEEALRRHLRLKELVGLLKCPETYQPGTQVVIALRDKQEFRYMLTRGEIIEVATRTYAGLPSAVRINCLDIGEIKLVRVDDILAMPEEMKGLRPCGVQVVLANTAPPFGEKAFRLSHISKTKDYFKLDPILQGDICLSIGNTIWVRRLVKLKRLEIGRVVETWDATFELCKKKILVRNPGHLEILYKSCEKTGYSCKQFRNNKTPGWCNDLQFQNDFHQISDSYDWAYLKVSNSIDTDNIISSTVAAKYISPENKIFVNSVKFEQMLETLEAELNEDILKLKRICDWNRDVEFYRFYEAGLVVAAVDDADGRFRRGIITEVEQKDSENDVEYLYKVFLVDVGVEGLCTMSSVFPIPKKYVLRLPFQAIRLSLEHIRSRKPKSADRKIYHRTMDFLMPDNLAVDVEVVALHNYRVNGDMVEINCYESFIFCGKDEISEFYLREKVALFTFEGETKMMKIKTALLEKFNSKISKLIKDEDDISDDESEVSFTEDSVNDGFDVNFECGLDEMIASMFPKKTFPEIGQKKPLEAPRTSKTEITGVKAAPTSLEETQLGQEKPREAPKTSKTEISGGAKATPTYLKNTKLGGPQPNQMPANAPHVIDVLKKADVLWFQNETIILLRVLIPDVTEYDCKLISKNELNFSTINPPGYGFTLNFCKRVEPTVKVQALGQYCEIKLRKRFPGLKWDVLTAATGLHWLKPELNLDDEEIPSDSSSKLLTYIDVDYEKMCEDQYNSDDDLFELGLEEDRLLE